MIAQISSFVVRFDAIQQREDLTTARGPAISAPPGYAATGSLTGIRSSLRIAGVVAIPTETSPFSAAAQ